MYEVMTTERWKKYTDAGSFSMRSSALKAVDRALGIYHSAPTAGNRVAIRDALDVWIRELGPSWKSDERNALHAVEHLWLQSRGYTGLDKVGSASQQRAEREAVQYIEAQRALFLKQLFAGARIEWRPGLKQKLANQKLGTVTAVPGVVNNARQLAPQRIAPTNNGATSYNVANKVLNELVPSSIMTEVVAALNSILPEFLKELAAAVTPFLGVFTAGGSAAYNGLKAVRSQYRIGQAQMHAQKGIRADGPGAAVEAVIEILKRERNADVFCASVALGEFGGKLAGALADGGTATTAAVGLAANLVKLTNIIRIIVLDVLEKNAANALMAKPEDLDLEVFATCPLVGCYLVVCAPTSVLVNMLTSKWGTLGWMDDVERMNTRHIAPLREQALRIIEEHRFVIPALQSTPALMKKNQKALDAMAANVGKSKYEGFGSDNLPESLRVRP